MNYDLAAFSKKLKKHLDKERYLHTQGVMYTAAAMAMAYGLDMEKAQIAGLLHDCAKCIPNDKKLDLCRKKEIPVTEIEEQAPFLLHAKLGVYIARKKYGVDDKEILSAIRWHTTGKPEMTDLDKIIYLADYIEPGRDRAPNLSQIRRLAFENLDECMYEVLKSTLDYLGSNPKTLDLATKDAFNYYEELHKNHLTGNHNPSEVKEGYI